MAWWEAMGFSMIVFGGSAQFAAVGVLGDGGSGTAAGPARGLARRGHAAPGPPFARAVWWDGRGGAGPVRWVCHVDLAVAPAPAAAAEHPPS